jgi:hypothetical protein
MDRGNRYEKAFEIYLRQRGLRFVAIDESRRTLENGESLKSLDFIVYGSQQARLLVDIKGRRFPGGTVENPNNTWQNWSTLEDINGLRRWEERFGSPYRGVIVFVYDIQTWADLPMGTPELLVLKNQRFLLRGIDAAEYRKVMRVRSPKWGTVGLGRDDFRNLVKPVGEFLD